jgi:hypothetical protein
VTPLLIAVSAAAAFNLICTGQQSVETYGAGNGAKSQEAFTETYRVNLDDKRWCRDDCLETSRLSDLRDNVIYFEFLSAPNSPIGTVAFVSRESGVSVLICPPLSGPETMIVWTTKGTTNAEQETQAGRDYRQAA